MDGAGADAAGDVNRAAALALLAAEPDGGVGSARALVRLCRAAVRGLSMSGAVVAVVSATGVEWIASSDKSAIRVAEIEFSLGEGPTHDAMRLHRPVFSQDLAGPDGRLWPAYARAALELGVGTVCAFPLSVGAVDLGVLTLYAPRPGSFDRDRSLLAAIFAELAIEILLDGDNAPVDDRLGPGLDAVVDAHA